MDVGKALRNTSKGQLKYDKYWVEEGRTQEVLDNISRYSTKVAINISPKILSQVIASVNQEKNNEVEDTTVLSSNSNSKSPKKSNDKCKYSDTIFYEQQTETELPILEYKEESLKNLKDKFEAKKEEFEKFSLNLKQQTEQQYQLLKRHIELDGKRRAADLKKIENSIIEEAKQKEFLLKQQHQSQAKAKAELLDVIQGKVSKFQPMQTSYTGHHEEDPCPYKKLSSIILEAEMKQKKAEEELKKKQQEQEEFLLQLNSCQVEAESSVMKAKEKLTSCEHSSFLKIPANDRISQMTELVEKIKEIADRTQIQPLTIEDIYNANDLVKKSYEILQDITNDIEYAKIKAVQDHEKKQQQLKEMTINGNITNINSEAASNESVGAKTDDKEKSPQKEVENKNKMKNEAKAIISGFIAPDAVEEYHRISENLKAIQNNIKGFVDDPRNKKLRFELQKSINVPINAISSVSGAHVRDKISRLLSILNAKTPNKDMPNETIIYNFCSNLIAKKFVEQGDKQISAQHSTAFPIALAAIGVWIKKPDVGSLILGHFYLNCPYLVPYYPPRMEKQSNQEYYESLGYHFDKEGKMEEKYKFLNRMSGFMRLYAAIILSPVPPGSVEYSHPHGIAHGWSWLSRILNMDPRPDITATLLYDFLDVTGHTLQKTYGKQFKKLLHIICKDFFQKIKQVTPSGSGGPVERLETFLQQTIKKGYIPPPEGILGPEFWGR